MSTFLTAECHRTGILPGFLFLLMRLRYVWAPPLPLLFSLSYSFHSHPWAPSSGDSFLPSSRLLFPAASYCQHYLSNANLKPESTVLLSMARLIPRMRATFSSNTRFYVAPLSPSPHPPSHSHGGLLIISCPMSPCSFSNGFLLMSDRLLFIL